MRSVAKFFQGFGVVGGSSRPQPVTIIGFAGDELEQMTELKEAMQQGASATQTTSPMPLLWVNLWRATWVYPWAMR